MSTTNTEFAKTLDMPAEFQAKAAAFADAKGLSLAGREVIAEFKDAWVGSNGKTRPANVVLIVTADAAMALALKAGRNFAPISTEWTSDGKEWVDVWINSAPPAACRVTFEVEGIAAPVVVVHTLAEYTQGNLSAVQRTMPASMLAKATTQMGLRRIAPQALAGLYVAEEMSAVDDAVAAEVERAGAVTAAVNAPDAESSGGKMSRAEQYVARRDELIGAGKALRADCGDEAAAALATHIKSLDADVNKLTAAHIKSILAQDVAIRKLFVEPPASEDRGPDPEPPAAEPEHDAGTQAVVDELDGKFVI